MTEPVPSPELLQLLLGKQSESAAKVFRTHPRWLQLDPPQEVVAAVTDPEQELESEVITLARAWSKSRIIPALLLVVAGQAPLDRRRRAAWVLKQVVGADQVSDLLPIALDADVDPIVRRYLVEGVTRTRSWEDTEPPSVPLDAVAALLESTEPGVREAAVALAEVAILDPVERRRRLIEKLDDDNDGVVLTALTALRGSGAAGIPIAVINALRRRGPAVAGGVADLDPPTDPSQRSARPPAPSSTRLRDEVAAVAPEQQDEVLVRHESGATDAELIDLLADPPEPSGGFVPYRLMSILVSRGQTTLDAIAEGMLGHATERTARRLANVLVDITRRDPTAATRSADLIAATIDKALDLGADTWAVGELLGWLTEVSESAGIRPAAAAAARRVIVGAAGESDPYSFAIEKAHALQDPTDPDDSSGGGVET